MMDSRQRQSKIPKELEGKLRSARASHRMRGERRVITMLFCDVTGSTSMAEQLDPEEWAEIMNEAFDYLIAPIYRYEGTLARMMGDGILAFFGAPIAHEDDPQRAIMAGLDIVQGLEPFRSEILEDYGLDFNVRVGINTGSVVVGDIGSDLAIEYTAMGDAINLAARMEETAGPGTVQISANTYRLIAPLFDVETLGEIEVKGKEEQVQSYRVLAPKAKPGRIRGIEGLETPLIGRADEIDQLRGLVGELDKGRGGIIFLIGEAGLGKSRLISELHADWVGQNGTGIQWHESQGIPYESNRPYGLFHRRLRSTLSIGQDDGHDTIRRKILQVSGQYADVDQEMVVQAVEAVLALSGDSETSLSEAEALRRQLLNLVLHIWRTDAAKNGLVAVFDDLHWADSASVELLNHLLQLVTQAPLLFICAMRPERDSPGWNLRQGAKQEYNDRYHEFTLAPLSETESDNLISQLLTIADLPPSLRRMILEKAEGNPFFVEEIVRALIDSGAIIREEGGLHWRAIGPVDELTIPDNLRSLLISRIDRLEKQSKRTLQLASVIGRSFYERILSHIADRIADLSSELQALQIVDLIMLSSDLPEVEYMFRHELTRDAAYHTILHRERRSYHRRVGEALESLMPDQAKEEAHRLAYHFDEARDMERALKYYIIAGDAAARIYANTETLNHYKKAQSIAKTIGSGDQLRHIYGKMGRVLEVRGQYDDAVENYRELGQLGEQRNEPELILHALMAQATIHSTYTSLFDPERGLSLAKQALGLAQELDDPEATARIYWILMLVNIFGLNNTRRAIYYGEKSLAIGRDHDLGEQLGYTLHDLSRPYMFYGRFDKAMDVLKEAGEIFRSAGNLAMLADNRATLSFGYSFMGRYQEAMALSEEALRISRSTGNLWGESYSYANIGLTHFALGHISLALDTFQESEVIARKGNFSGALTYGPIFSAGIYGYLGEYELGVETINHGLQMAEETGLVHERIDLLVGLARLLMDSGNVGEARKYVEEVDPHSGSISANPTSGASFAFTKAKLNIYEDASEAAIADLEPFISWARNAKLHYFLPEALLIVSRGYKRLNRLSEAMERLEEGLTIALDSGMAAWQPFLSIELAQVVDELGHFERAKTLKLDAGHSLEYVAGHIDDLDMRNRFLNRIDIREII